MEQRKHWTATITSPNIHKSEQLSYSWSGTVRSTNKKHTTTTYNIETYNGWATLTLTNVPEG